MSFYNPETPDEGAAAIQPGTYAFKVHDVEEKTFNSGNHGAKVTLLTDIDGRFIKVFCNLIDSPKSIWMIKGFMASLGLDYKSPPPPMELLGRLGRAEYKVGDNGYLEVKKFIAAPPLSASTSVAKSAPKPQREPGSDDGPPPPTDDDVPW